MEDDESKPDKVASKNQGPHLGQSIAILHLEDRLDVSLWFGSPCRPYQELAASRRNAGAVVSRYNDAIIKISDKISEAEHRQRWNGTNDGGRDPMKSQSR